jgi:hypothetical protein
VTGKENSNLLYGENIRFFHRSTFNKNSVNYLITFRPTSSSKKLFCNPYGPPIYPRERPVISVEENQGNLLRSIVI